MDRASHLTLRLAAAGLAAATTFAAVAAPVAAAARATAQPQQATSAAPWKDLDARAKKNGAVPVIVELNLDGGRPALAQLGKHAKETKSVRGKLLKELGRDAADVKDFGTLPLVAIEATPKELARLKASGLVASVKEDLEFDLGTPLQKGHPEKIAKVRRSESTIAPKDGATPAGTSPRGAESGSQLPQFWDYYQIGADKAAAAGRTGTGQVVAVLDTGVDRNHPWLAGDVLREACYSSRTPGAVAGDCPNGKSAQTGTGAAAPCALNGCDHGTHVAHTIAGQYGIAPGAKLIAVQVFHWTADGPRTWESDYILGLKFVYDLRASYAIAAVNMSLGGGGYVGYCDNQGFDKSTNPTYVTGWINALSSVNIATVVASGNNDYTNAVSYPACISSAISVGNTTLDPSGYEAVLGYTTYGSNSNVTLDLLAPGTDICSAVPNSAYDCTKYGTSMATPHVAGAIAILKQKRPGATVAQLLNALYTSGPAIYDSRNGISRIRINVYTAVTNF